MDSAPGWRRAPDGRFSSAAGLEAASGSQPDPVPRASAFEFNWIDRSVQTAARARPERPDGRTASGALVNRRHRLSRSRDFDAVYRHGRSVSTRFLILYSFSRDDDAEPRLGIAVPKGIGNAPVRSKIKRRLREVWRARVESLPTGQDYVLIVRPGLVEAADVRGFEWLGERVDEVLGKAAA